MSETKYVVELTEEEATVLAMIERTYVEGPNELIGPLLVISGALLKADPTLEDKQYDLWKKLDKPNLYFTAKTVTVS